MEANEGPNPAYENGHSYFFFYDKTGESPAWRNSSAAHKAVFVTILMEANKNWAGRRWYDAQAGQEIYLPPGSFTTSYRKFADLAEVSPKAVRNAFDRLAKQDFITVETRARNTIIRVCNWARYQASAREFRGTTRGTSDMRRNPSTEAGLAESNQVEGHNKGHGESSTGHNKGRNAGHNGDSHNSCDAANIQEDESDRGTTRGTTRGTRRPRNTDLKTVQSTAKRAHAREGAAEKTIPPDVDEMAFNLFGASGILTRWAEKHPVEWIRWALLITKSKGGLQSPRAFATSLLNGWENDPDEYRIDREEYLKRTGGEGPKKNGGRSPEERGWDLD
jgi:hypothetical protein